MSDNQAPVSQGLDETIFPSRRAFLKAVAATGTALAAGSAGCITTPGKQRQASAFPAKHRQMLRLAYIGTGGMGGSHVESTQELEVVCPCFCDIDTERMAQAVEAFPNATRYQDYRKLFDKEHDNIDAVMIGTPDHHHYPATMIAMQLGKHVYTQKPLTHTVWEARKLAEAAKKYPVVTQMGNQGHAGEGWRLVYEWIHGGALGTIKEVHSWTDRPIWPQGMGRPEETDEVPAHVDWDIWLGPAPVRPFKLNTYHPFYWRGWWDFGAGALGDMACHIMDGIFLALDPGSPSSVEPIACGAVNDETFPKAAMIKWEFPRRGWRPAFDCYWYDGGLKPPFPAELESGRRLPDNGNLFIGTKASILVSGAYGGSPRIFPEAKMKEIGKPKQLLERSPGHIEEWVMAARGEKPADFARSNFAYAGPFTEAVLLGNIAVRVGRRLEWDAKTMTFPNFPAANQYVTKEYREGWRY